MTFAEAFRRELRKLRRPAVVITIVLSVALAVASMTVGAQREAARLDLGSFFDQCDDSLQQQECRTQLAPQREAQLRSTNYVTAREQQAQQTHPLGVGVLVGGHFGTALGWIMVLVIAAAHIAGEYGQGTVSWAVTLSRRTHFLAAKYFTTWLTAMGAVALATVVAAIAVPRLTPGVPGSPAVDVGAAAAASGVGLLRCALVIAGACALLLLLSVVTRSQLGTIGGAVLILGFGLALGEGISLLPTSLVRDLLDIRPGRWPIPYGYIWRDAAPPAARLAPETATAVWLALTVVWLGVAAVLFRRADLTD
jgi:hypothetical protein